MRCFIRFFVALFAVSCAWGQTAPQSSGGSQDTQAPVQRPSQQIPPTTKQEQRKQKRSDKPDNNQRQSRRIFGVIPAYDVTNTRGQQIEPLTKGQKFKLFLEDTYDPFEWIWSGAEAGFEQAAGEQKSYRQGAAGYAKRFGAAMADESTGEFFGTFLLPTVLRQDPRYFRKGEGSFSGRLGYALTRVAVTRSDSGKRQFNWSYIGGTLISGGLSNLYYPREDRGFGLTMSRSGIAILAAAGVAAGKEFWPDVERKLHKKKQP
jgi:hypothetical protein